MKRFALALLALSSSATAGRVSRIPVERAVLVHGFFQNKWRCYGFLKHDLEKRGVECLVPSLKPADARDGIPALAAQLKREIDTRFGPSDPILLVGFSMGGLVSRHYLQELGGSGRCKGLVTISSPHHGTRLAALYPGEGAEQMRIGSEWLARLAATEHRLGGIPTVSYRTPADLVILPSRSSEWSRADNVVIPCPLHPMMTWSPKLRKDLLSRLSTPR